MKSLYKSFAPLLKAIST